MNKFDCVRVESFEKKRMFEYLSYAVKRMPGQDPRSYV